MTTDNLPRMFLSVYQAERQRLGRSIHDGVSQLLAALSMHLNLLHDACPHEAEASLAECQSLVVQAIDETRELSLDLTPFVFPHVTLPVAVRHYLERQAQRTGLNIRLSMSASWNPVPREIEHACLRVIQEAVTNVCRHAAASQVHVSVRQDAENVEFSIRDDGVGFVPEACLPWSPDSPKLGLAVMQQQVNLLGGHLQIASAPGQGTKIQVTLPIDLSCKPPLDA